MAEFLNTLGSFIRYFNYYRNFLQTMDDIIIECMDQRKFVLCQNNVFCWSKQILVTKILAIEIMACQNG